LVSSRSASLAHGERQPFRLLEVKDLGGEIVAPQRDAEQELQPGHDPVAIADAETALDQVQLEAANVLSGGRVGERFKNAANRLQLWMWLRCVW